MENLKALQIAWDNRSKLRAEGDKLRAGGDKLQAESNKLQAESNAVAREMRKGEK